MMRLPKKRRRKWLGWLSLSLVVGLLAIGAALWYWHYGHYKIPTILTQSVDKSPKQTATAFDKTQYSLSQPASPWVVVNKLRPLTPKEYVPADLMVPNVPLRGSASSPEMHVRKDATAAMEQLFAGAKVAGINLQLASGYRSYQYQVQVYGGFVKADGQTSADAESARPGYSEHQTGWAADIGTTDSKCTIAQCFGTTPGGIWLAQHAYEYGFIIRYQQDKVPITGYEYEPWHVRYIGASLSREMHRVGITTLEEFFGLPAAPNYQ